MSTYTDTYLSVKVTATGNTARTMRSWTPAARQEYLRDQIVMFLNGRRPDFCVECVDLEAERLERQNARVHTDADLLGMADSLDALDEPEHAKECRKIVSDRRESEQRAKELLERVRQKPTPAPQPVDAGGEWPKWIEGRASDRIGRHDAAKVSTWFERKGGTRSGRCSFAMNLIGAREITPTQAARWLRENGHAKVADEIEFEPVGTLPVVGDFVVDLRHRDAVLRIDRIDGRTIVKGDGYVVGPKVFGDAPELHQHRILKRAKP